MMRSVGIIRFCLPVLAAICATAHAPAQQPPGAPSPPPLAPTQAWRNFLAATQIGGVDTDSNGYCYVTFTDASNGSNLVKIGPCKNTPVAVNSVNTNPSLVYPPAVTPLISGYRFVYMIRQISPSGFNYIDASMYNATTGALVFDQQSSSVPNASVIGQYVTSAGHLLLALDYNNTLMMVDLNGPNGGIVTAAMSGGTNSSITPTAAAYDPTSGSWFVTGLDPSDPHQVNAVWGSYNPSTGAQNFGGALTGTYDSATGNKITYSFVISLLPGNKFALATNSQTFTASTSSTFSFYTLRLADRSTNAQTWIYPSAGTDNGTTLGSVVANDTSSPIYGIGVADSFTAGHPPQNLRVFDWSGNRTYIVLEQPLGTLFPTSDGFWDLFDWVSAPASFLEHYATPTTSWFGERSMGLTPLAVHRLLISRSSTIRRRTHFMWWARMRPRTSCSTALCSAPLCPPLRCRPRLRLAIRFS